MIPTLGTPVNPMDPNQLMTEWKHDGFGCNGPRYMQAAQKFLEAQ